MTPVYGTATPVGTTTPVTTTRPVNSSGWGTGGVPARGQQVHSGAALGSAGAVPADNPVPGGGKPAMSPGSFPPLEPQEAIAYLCAAVDTQTTPPSIVAIRVYSSPPEGLTTHKGECYVLLTAWKANTYGTAKEELVGHVRDNPLWEWVRPLLDETLQRWDRPRLTEGVEQDARLRGQLVGYYFASEEREKAHAVNHLLAWVQEQSGYADRVDAEAVVMALVASDDSIFGEEDG